MTPEMRNVKYASFLSLLCGVIVAIGAVYGFATKAAGVSNLALMACGAVDLLYYGFACARAANVPATMEKLATSAMWSPLLPALCVAYLFFDGEASNTFIVVACIIGVVGGVALAVTSFLASKKLKEA